MTSKRGTGFLNKVEAQAVLCGAYIGNTLVTGLFNGQIVSWNGTSLAKAFEAHKGSVTAMCARGNNAGIVTGGKDGNVIVWSEKLQKAKTISIAQPETNCFIARVVSVHEHADGKRLLVGSRGGEIIELAGDK